MLNPNLPSPTLLKERFQTARPFKHLVLDDFLIPSVAEGLLAEFPVSAPSKTQQGSSSVQSESYSREEIRSVGASFRTIDDYISSLPFLRHISLISGIPDLQYDSSYFEAGICETRHGQEVDPHVESNLNQELTLHRRLLLIIYLNKEWEESWGGLLDLHSDPKAPERDETLSYSSVFNRCIVLETTEHSWFGSTQICLPSHQKHLSQKSFSFFLYTKDRPSQEAVPPHQAFYVPRSLSMDLSPGKSLSEEECATIQRSVRRRDQLLYYYQNLELEMSGQYQSLRHHAEELRCSLRLELAGYVVQASAPEGYHPDRWIVGSLKANLVPLRPISRIELRLHIPATINCERQVSVRSNGQEIKTVGIPPGTPVVCGLDLPEPISDPFLFEICGETFTPRSLGINADNRPLLCRLEGIMFLHPT